MATFLSLGLSLYRGDTVQCTLPNYTQTQELHQFAEENWKPKCKYTLPYHLLRLDGDAFRNYDVNDGSLAVFSSKLDIPVN